MFFLLLLLLLLSAGCVSTSTLTQDYYTIPNKATKVYKREPSYASIKALKDKENKTLFLWPVQGKIISYFGDEIGNKKNKGIEIQINRGTPIYASAKGKVTFSSYIKGYGKTIIIRHFNDISTVYANLSRISVKEGEYVKKGQIIGNAGNSLYKGKNIFHFEVRKGYKAQNPLVYLKH